MQFQIVIAPRSDGSHVFNVRGTDADTGVSCEIGAESAQHAHEIRDVLNRCAFIDFTVPAASSAIR